MRTARRNRTALILVCIIVFALAIALIIGLLAKKEPEDPHKGQVYIYDGFDWIWMTPLEGVPANDFTEDMFTSANGPIRYTGSDYTVLRGVDVSEHQLDIDWPRVAASGVDYAYIRLGWRGYTEGGLFEDAYFVQNMQGAQAAGLQLGVYMFSQAVTVQEAIDEANFVLDRISAYNVTLPVVFDWEKIEDSAARTHGLSVAARTDCARAFCETVRNAGYPACIYFNRNLGYYGYDLTRLTDYEFWFSLPESGFPNFYYACDMWQYSFSETVPGIEGPTDMNLRFIPLVSEDAGSVQADSK